MTSTATLTIKMTGCALIIALGTAGSLAVAAQERKPIEVFTGSGERTTEPFTVSDNWTVEWSTEDERIEIVLKDTNSGIPSVTASPVDPGSGATEYVRGGTFRFEVRAQGAWRISVFQDQP